MKRRELLVIFVFASLITWGSGFVSHPALGCGFGSTMPDALCEGGWPLAFHRVGGVLGFDQWSWNKLILDFLFWFLVLATGWWSIERLNVRNGR